MHMSTQLPSCLLSQAQHFNKILFTQKALTRLSKKKRKTRYVCETQCPRQWPIPTKANITRTNILIPVVLTILPQEITMCSMEALVSYFKEGMTNVNFILVDPWSNVKVKSLRTYNKISSQGIFM